jgi:hypothetical protein
MADCCRIGLYTPAVCLLLPSQDGGAGEISGRWDEERQDTVRTGHQDLLETTFGCRRNMVLVQFLGVSIQHVLELHYRHYLAS